MEKQIDQLDELYVLDLNDVDPRIEELSRMTPDVWYDIAMSCTTGYDLRAISARVFVQGCYPTTDTTYPRVQTPHELSQAQQECIENLVNTGELMTQLGVLEGLDQVGDLTLARKLASAFEDRRAKARLLEFEQDFDYLT